jgi:hypothetical protein
MGKKLGHRKKSGAGEDNGVKKKCKSGGQQEI